MSFDGEERIVIVRSSDDDTIARRVRPILKWKEGRTASRIVTLQYVFGFGETYPIAFKQLDALVKLPWRVDGAGGPANEVRVLPSAAVANALKILDDLRSKPRALSRRISAIVSEPENHLAALTLLKGDSRKVDSEDAESTSARLAQFFMQLRRATKRAAKAGEAVAVGLRISKF